MLSLGVVHQVGLWLGVLAVGATALGALCKNQDDAENVELTAAAFSVVALMVVGGVVLTLGGLPAIGMFLGSFIISLVCNVALIKCIEALVHRMNTSRSRTLAARS